MRMTSIQQQSGAALVVGLMILLLATFLAVASLNNANMQERMAANSQNENLAFQAAESAIDDQIRRVLNGDTARISAAKLQENNATPVWPSTTYNAGHNDINTTIEIRSMGDVALSVGNSIDADESSVRLGVARFEMRSLSTMTGSGARINIIQGIEYR